MKKNPFRRQEETGIGLFVTAGFPEINSLPAQLLLLQKQGAAFIEVGMPFSDPLADGETIQRSSAIALEQGMNLDLMFSQIASVRQQIQIPLVLMGYFNPVFTYGMEAFLNRCVELEIKSLIIPDLSPEIYERSYRKLFEQKAVTPVFLITPRTENKRIQQLAAYSAESFLYLVSSNSITGAEFELSETAEKRYRAIKNECGTVPLYIGFGITNHRSAMQVGACADGVIVGSAYLRALENKRAEHFLDELFGKVPC